jgi:hypothetical protein
VSVDVVTRTLGVERRAAAKLLSRWRQQGWLRRIGPGLYVAVPLDLAGSEQAIADPWVLVPTLFGPCYIGSMRNFYDPPLRSDRLGNRTVRRRPSSDQLEFEIYDNSRGRPNCQAKIVYRGSVSPTSSGWPKIKLDLTPDERLGWRAMSREKNRARLGDVAEPGATDARTQELIAGRGETRGQGQSGSY